MKKILSFLLAAAVFLTTCAVPVFAEDASRILYYNDFEIDAAHNAGLSLNSNTIELEEDKAKGSSVLKFKTPDNGVRDDAFWQPNVNNEKFKNLVISMEISTQGQTPIIDIVIADAAGTRFQIGRVEKNSNLLDADGAIVGTVEKGKYHKLSYVLDFNKKTYDTYLDKRNIGKKQPIRGIDFDISWIRLYMERFAEGTFLVDNFVVYEGDKVRDITKEAEALPKPIPMIGPITPGSGKMYEIDYADMSKTDGGVALLLDSKKAYAKGELTETDVAPLVLNNRTLVPVRFISENFGADVSWNADEKKVTVKGEKTIELTIDDPKIVINGSEQALDAAAVVVDNRTMLPLRALCEALGKNVFWDERGVILITEKKLDENKDKRLITAMYGYLKTGKLALNYAAAPQFDKEVAQEAFDAQDFDFSAVSGNTTYSFTASKALYYLTLMTHLDETAVSSDGSKKAKDEALRRIRDLTSGGKEPYACVGPYWSHAVVAASLALAKNTPAIYSSLTEEEKDRCDWLMRALAVAGNWGFNDCNNYTTGVDLKGNFAKQWNPNYRNTYLNVVLSAAMYFGADELDKIYESFSYDEYIEKFEEYGYKNIIATWSVAGKDAMEKGGEVKLTTGQSGGTGKGVKQKFTYNGNGLDSIDKIFDELENYTYGAVCQDKYGSPDGAYYCYIISGAETPYAGYNGMMFEFAATGRSSAGYCYDSLFIVNSMLANFKLLYGYDSTKDWQKTLDSLMYVGNEDFFFKAQEGYYGYSSNGGPAKYFDYSGGRALRMDKDIWRNFHCMGNEKIVTGTDPNPPAVSVLPSPAAEPKDGITKAPEGATLPTKVTIAGNFPKESAISIGSFKEEFDCEFDLAFDSEVNGKEFDGVIIHDGSISLDKPTGFTIANTAIQFSGGRINVRDGGKYYQTKFPVAPNYRYHIRMSADVKKKTYSVWITPTYPAADSEQIAANAVEFRLGARKIDDIGCLVPVVVSDKGTYWIENYKCSGK